MKLLDMKRSLARGALDARLAEVYGPLAVAAQKVRYSNAIDAFAALYGEERDIALFSVSGRSELSGNHTDHNHGCVVAASINLDIIAVASANADNVIRVKSEGFGQDEVDITAYNTPDPAMYATSASIIAGMSAQFAQSGLCTGGFDAYTTSDVLKGSGISSSAAFEDMIGNILNHLYNDGKVDNVEIAKMSQKAENQFFGKPCGLMDQVACAHGGIVAIDFADPTKPVIRGVPFDITAAGYALCIVNTGGNHADLTDDYASIPAEMKAVAAHFGKKVLREVDEADVIAAIPELREQLGDRAILRALHFFAENKRVLAQTDALLSDDLDAFLSHVCASGQSSFCYLQNIYTTKAPNEQGLSLALCLAERVLSGKKAAWRVHGGGFAGTIQAFVPAELVEKFRAAMDDALGEGACLPLHIRQIGACKIA